MYGVLRHEQDAREAAHEVWVRLYYALPQYQFNGFKTWLSRIAVHKAIDWKRRKDRRKEELLDTQEPDGEQLVSLTSRSDDIEQVLLNKERQALIQKQVRQMPETYRSVVTAYYLQQRSYKEIAAEHGLEVKSVESRLYRAKQWMRKHWKEEDWL
ncbi:RNA polymerase sigma factor SigW [Xylanibacillus composti]|uniref:RNA polymerase sigma factor SigW n=1 Tax=Xylanibacillus composti TaxID=1572762 RepID=A0A8J4M1L0_9BACL|nr:RNA polymerase sigma factor SigW [Xylanibacillus composti]